MPDAVSAPHNPAADRLATLLMEHREPGSGCDLCILAAEVRRLRPQPPQWAKLRDPVSFPDLIQQAKAVYDAMSPEQQAAHDAAQRESWARGNVELDRIERRSRETGVCENAAIANE